MIWCVKSQARFPLNWTPYFTHCPRLSVWTNLRRGVRNCLPLFSQGGQVKVRKEGAVLKRTFSARGNFLRTWEIVTSSQARKKNPSAAQCKAEGSTPRETANAKEAHRCECGFKSPLATHTVGLRKIQNANKHKTQKRVGTMTVINVLPTLLEVIAYQVK